VAPTVALPQVDNSNFICRVNFVDPQIVLVRDPQNKGSDAVTLIAGQLTVSLDATLTVNFHKLGMFFCVMDSPKTMELRFLDDANITVITDRQESKDSITNYVFIDTSSLLFRVSYQDVLLLLDLYNRILSPQAPAKDNDLQAITPQALKRCSEKVLSLT
jgi:vacuolar protein sorting-associated protein 13A/C